MDLIVAVIFISMLSVFCLLVGYQLGRHRSRRVRIGVQLTGLVIGLVYFLFLWDRPILSRILPHTALIVLANWHPLIGSLFAGMYFAARQVHHRRRLWIGAGTLALSAYSIFSPLLRTAPFCGAEAIHAGILVTQTTPHTCSPAVAASLLRLHGIPVSEAEMADICLTGRGTHWMGLYRGLRIMTHDTPWQVMALEYDPRTVQRLGRTPAVLALNLNPSRFPATSDHGFHSDAGHSVLALDCTDPNSLMVFDPSPGYGIEYWPPRLLSGVSGGVVLFLQARDGNQREAEIAMRVRDAQQQERMLAAADTPRRY